MSWRRKRLFHIKRLRKLFIVYKDERVRVRFEVCGERNALVARRSLSEQTLRELYGNKSGNGGETMRANQNTLRVAPGFPSEGQRHFMERARKIFAAIVCRRCCLIFLKAVSSFFFFFGSVAIGLGLAHFLLLEVLSFDFDADNFEWDFTRNLKLLSAAE